METVLGQAIPRIALYWPITYTAILACSAWGGARDFYGVNVAPTYCIVQAGYWGGAGNLIGSNNDAPQTGICVVALGF